MKTTFAFRLIFVVAILLTLLPITQASAGKSVKSSKQAVLEQSDDNANSQSNLETKDADSVAVINWKVLSNGGTTSTSPNYRISGTLSQTGIGYSSTPSEDVNLHSGYWQDFSSSGSICGDVDSSGYVDIDDIMYLINYIFLGGPIPEPIDSGDPDCSGYIDIDDIMYLINFIFLGGPEPCAACP